MDSSLVSSIAIMVVLFLSFRMLPRLIAGVPFVEPVDVVKHLEKDKEAVLIDVRTPEEFKQERATESINVQPYEFGENIEEKRAYLDNHIFVICQSSQRAAMAAKQLKKYGFINVRVVKGGLIRWKKRNLPVV